MKPIVVSIYVFHSQWRGIACVELARDCLKHG
jgi:hypothetical protein